MTIPVQTSPTRLVFTPTQPRLGQRIRSLDDQRRAPASEPPHLSYSQVRTFSQCPLQWYLSRNYAPAFVSSALVFGGGFHVAAEAYYQARLEGRNAELPELLAVFDQHPAPGWQCAGYGSPAGRHHHRLALGRATHRYRDRQAGGVPGRRRLARRSPRQRFHARSSEYR